MHGVKYGYLERGMRPVFSKESIPRNVRCTFVPTHLYLSETEVSLAPGSSTAQDLYFVFVYVNLLYSHLGCIVGYSVLADLLAQ